MREAHHTAELDLLLEEERLLSIRRTTVHDRLSWLGAGDEQAKDLREQERRLSDERRALQKRIDALRRLV